MKANCLRNYIILLLIVESQCGLIDWTYDKVKNTTKAVGRDIKNVWNYGRNVIYDEEEIKPMKPEERGLIGGWLHSMREKMHSIHDYFWKNDDIPDNSGVMTKMYNKVKAKLSKIKSFMTDGDEKAVTNIETVQEKIPEDTKVVREAMAKLFYRNGTRRVNGEEFQNIINILKLKLREIRRNVTGLDEDLYYGEEQLDARGVIQDNGTDKVVTGVANNVYDAVENDAKNMNSKVKENADALKNSVVDRVKQGEEKIMNSIDRAQEEVEKEKELFNAV